MACRQELMKQKRASLCQLRNKKHVRNVNHSNYMHKELNFKLCVLVIASGSFPLQRTASSAVSADDQKILYINLFVV